MFWALLLPCCAATPAQADVVDIYLDARGHVIQRVTVEPGTSGGDGDGTEGPRWQGTQVTLVGSHAGEDEAATEGAFSAAAQTWTALNATPRLALEWSGTGGEPTRNNVNQIVMYAQGWPGKSEALALTYRYIRADDDVMVEADVLVNLQDHRFEVVTSQQGEVYDLQNMMTHELGHVLGLPDDLRDPERTMFRRIDPREIKKRDLTEADIQALRHLYADYAPADAAAGCDCASAYASAPLWLLLGLAGWHHHRRSHPPIT